MSAISAQSPQSRQRSRSQVKQLNRLVPLFRMGEPRERHCGSLQRNHCEPWFIGQILSSSPQISQGKEVRGSSLSRSVLEVNTLSSTREGVFQPTSIRLAFHCAIAPVSSFFVFPLVAGYLFVAQVADDSTFLCRVVVHNIGVLGTASTSAFRPRFLAGGCATFFAFSVHFCNNPTCHHRKAGQLNPHEPTALVLVLNLFLFFSFFFSFCAPIYLPRCSRLRRWMFCDFVWSVTMSKKCS